MSSNSIEKKSNTHQLTLQLTANPRIPTKFLTMLNQKSELNNGLMEEGIFKVHHSISLSKLKELANNMVPSSQSSKETNSLKKASVFSTQSEELVLTHLPSLILASMETLTVING
jgi:hypothetical protein